MSGKIYKFRLDEMRLMLALNYMSKQDEFMKWSMYDKVIKMYEVILTIKPIKK